MGIIMTFQRPLLKTLSYIMALLICFGAFSLPVFAAPDPSEDYLAAAEERKTLPIQTNQIENWPAGPAIGAEGAILLEANTGVVLYAKNINEKLYPASTTKLMTCLLAVENCELDEVVSFSHEAVFALEPGSSNIGIDEGQAMTLEECLYGILVASANEVANAVAEHVAGSMDAFAEKMNQRASELGCKNTHFVNAHGLYSEEHYTSPYDLALIAKAFFQNEILSKIGNTASHHFTATSTQPDDFVVRNKHQLITGEIPYEGIKGGKTGYTEEARQTLVTCAEQNGMKLICVVMKEESPEQFYDTVKLLDYGFARYEVYNTPSLTQETLPVLGGKKDSVLLDCTPQSFVLEKGQGKKVEILTELPENLKAPVEKGQILGKIVYKLDGKELGSKEICVKESVDRLSKWDLFKKMFSLSTLF